jgi:hypothetical protein
MTGNVRDQVAVGEHCPLRPAGWTASVRIIHDEQGAYFEINLT